MFTLRRFWGSKFWWIRFSCKMVWSTTFLPKLFNMNAKGTLHYIYELFWNAGKVMDHLYKSRSFIDTPGSQSKKYFKIYFKPRNTRLLSFSVARIDLISFARKPLPDIILPSSVRPSISSDVWKIFKINSNFFMIIHIFVSNVSKLDPVLNL